MGLLAIFQDVRRTGFWGGEPLCVSFKVCWVATYVVCIAEPTSVRTNLSPFTKGCRDGGSLMRLLNFWNFRYWKTTLRVQGDHLLVQTGLARNRCRLVVNLPGWR